MGVNYSPKINTDRLVLCLDAANIKSYPGGKTPWIDLTGNGLDGVFFGPEFSTIAGGSFNFFGVDEYVLGDLQTKILSIPIESYPFTLSCWANTPRSTRQIMFSIHSGSVDYFSIGTNNNKWSIEARRSNQEFTSSTIDVALDQWTFIAATFDSSTDRKLYVNGVLEGTDEKSVGFITPTQYFVGRQRFLTSGHGSLFYEGLISIVQLYSRTLTIAEINQNFNAHRSRFGV
jgi:hypothetical protein